MGCGRRAGRDGRVRDGSSDAAGTDWKYSIGYLYGVFAGEGRGGRVCKTAMGGNREWEDQKGVRQRDALWWEGEGEHRYGVWQGRNERRE
jgi:hypothetical protein